MKEIGQLRARAFTTTTTYFTYDGSNLIQEGASGVGPSRVYVHGGRTDEIVASWAGGNWNQHQYDAQGNCILLTDSGGNILEQYDYDAFGFPYVYDRWGNYIGGLPGANRFLFTGREWIKELRLYDYRARMYQPELGRFLQPDPKEYEAGDYNLYRYCHNDPVNKSDPTGLIVADSEDKELAKPVLVKETNLAPPVGSHIPIHVRVFNSGSWNDGKIANHKTTNLERDTGKGGLTIAKGSSSVSGNNVDINMNVNWYWDPKYAGTDVITREIQHVRDARTLEKDYWSGTKAATLSDFRNFAGIVRGFSIMQKNQYEGLLGKSHDLKTHPPIPAVIPECEDEVR